VVSTRRTARSTFERVYSAVILVKGIDGLVELLCGLVLLVAPRITGALLKSVAAELSEGTSPLRVAAARSVASAGSGVLAGAALLAIFLLIHGVVKLVTVWALLRRAIRWYPWALAALGALLIVQVLDLAAAPRLGGAVLGALDVVVIVVVGWEYRRLRAELRRSGTARAPRPSARPHESAARLQRAEQQ